MKGAEKIIANRVSMFICNTFRCSQYDTFFCYMDDGYMKFAFQM